MFKRSRLRRLLVTAGGAFVFLTSIDAASALQYQRVPLDPPLIGIAATGPIVPGDFDRLDAFIGTLSETDHIVGFFIDSPGGNIFEAEKIAAFINKTAATVTIPNDSQCASACFLLFAAAAHRFMGPNALIGVHSASDNGEENLASMGFTTAFARDASVYGVPDAIIGKMVQTEPGRMNWLTPTDLKPMDVVILNPSSPQARSLPTLPQTPSSPQERPLPTAPPTSQPQQMVVFIMPVTGAPGEPIQESLALALKRHLSASGIRLTSDPSPYVYTVQGTVTLGAAGWWHRSINIDWSVFNPSGKRLGTVHQANTIPKGSLNDAWSLISETAASGATPEIIRLLVRERNPQSVQYAR